MNKKLDDFTNINDYIEYNKREKEIIFDYYFNKPYCILINERNQAYPLNRNYKPLGQLTDEWVIYPINEVTRIYLYSDDYTKSLYFEKNRKKYEDKLARLKIQYRFIE